MKEKKQKIVYDRVALPSSLVLVVIIMLAILVTYLFTGKISEEEAKLEKRKAELERKMRKNDKPNTEIKK